MDLTKIESQLSDWTSGDQNNHPVTKFYRWFQNIAYGLANIWGQGETLSKVMSQIDNKLGAGRVPSSAEISAIINSMLANNSAKNSKILNYIDSMISRLPPAYSQTIKHIVQRERKKLNELRSTTAARMTKVESLLNNANATASQLDYLPYASKTGAVGNIKTAIQTAANEQNDLDSVERNL